MNDLILLEKVDAVQVFKEGGADYKGRQCRGNPSYQNRVLRRAKWIMQSKLTL